MKKFLVMITLLVGASLIAGCINMNVVSTVNDDGSGTWKFGFSFDEEMLAMMGEDAAATEDGDFFDGAFGEDMSDTITDEETGIVFSAAQEDIDDASWYIVTADIPDLESWANLETAFANMEEEGEEAAEDAGAEDAEAMGELGEELDPTEDLNLFPVVTITDGVLRVEITGPAPAESMASDEESSEMQFFDVNDLLVLTYEFSLPGEITDTNGEIDPETGNVVWTVDFTSEEPINFYAETSVE